MTHTAEQLLYSALTLLDEEKVEEAVTVLEEAAQVATFSRRELDLIRAHTLLGQILEAAEDVEAALEHFDEALLAGTTYSGDQSEIEEELTACRASIQRLRSDS